MMQHSNHFSLLFGRYPSTTSGMIYLFVQHMFVLLVYIIFILKNNCKL